MKAERTLIPELKPCPFCNGGGVTIESLADGTYYVECECGATGPSAATPENAGDDGEWGSRPRERTFAEEAVIRAAVAWHGSPALDVTSDELAAAVDALLASNPEWGTP